MPNRPRPEQKAAKNLKEYDGQIIEIVGSKVVIPKTGYNAGKPRMIATLADGENVWLPPHVVDNFEVDGAGNPIPNGRYTVETFTTAYGKGSAALRDL